MERQARQRARAHHCRRRAVARAKSSAHQPGAVLKLTVLGCGEAFGSGGRFQTSFLLESNGYRLLLDCGSTTLTAMRKFDVDPLSIDAICISHLHGDHFGGLPFLDRFLNTKSSPRPLTILGPSGLPAVFNAVLGAFFPGHAEKTRKYSVEIRTYREVDELGPFRIRTWPVAHDPASQPHALRVEAGGKVLAFSGDTQWTDTLLEASRDADLFICECVGYDQAPPYHLDYQTLMSHRLTCSRIMLTHMDSAVLDRLPLPGVEAAADGLRLEL